MNSTISPPASLGPRAQAPHKTSRLRDLGEVSHLERSFAEGKLDEMEYWLQSGVVKQAMAGQTRSKRDYALVLLDRLSEKLANIGYLDTADWKRFNTVLDNLWDLGACAKTEHHGVWLRRLPIFDVADKIVGLGQHPGKNEPEKEHGEIRLSGKDHRSALERLFHLMVERQEARRRHVGKNAETSIPAAWVARAERFLAMEGHDVHVLNQVLGRVARGDYGKRANSKTPWAQWRDKLLDLGANAMMAPGDALDVLAQTAPTRPLYTDDAWSELLRRHDKAQHPGKAPAALVQQVLEEQVGKRALRWTRFARSWLNALERVHPVDCHTALDRPLTKAEWAILDSSWRYCQVSQSPDNWAQLLDAPSGVEIARRMAQGLQKRGQLLPWSAQPTGQEDGWRRSRVDAKDLVCINNKLSARRLAALAELLADPGVRTGVDDKWRVQAVEQATIYDGLGDTRNDPPPSLTFELERKTRWMTPTPLGGSRKLNRSFDELDGLLALGGPRVLHTPPSSCKWANFMMQCLPNHWQAAEIPEDGRRAYLASLDRWGALDELVKTARKFNGLSGNKEQVGQEFTHLGKDLCYDWYSGWLLHGADQMLLADHFSDRPDIARGIKRLAVLCWVSGLYLVHQDMERSAPEGAPQWAKTCCTLDPEVLELAELTLLHETGKIGSTCREGQQNKAVWGWKRLMDLGWSPAYPQACLETLAGAMIQGSAMVSDGALGVLPDLVRGMGDDPNHSEGVFIETLCQKGAGAGDRVDGWVLYCQQGIERGAEFILEPQDRTHALGRAVGIALDRRNLGRLAQGQANDQGLPRRKM